jgi:hypothetical protein
VWVHNVNGGGMTVTIVVVEARVMMVIAVSLLHGKDSSLSSMHVCYDGASGCASTRLRMMLD